MEWILEFKTLDSGISVKYVVTSKSSASSLLARLLLRFAPHTVALEVVGDSVIPEEVERAPRVLLEDALASLFELQGQPLSALGADPTLRTATLRVVVGSIGRTSSALHPQAEKQAAQGKPAAKRRSVQIKVGQASSAGQTQLLDKAAMHSWVGLPSLCCSARIPRATPTFTRRSNRSGFCLYAWPSSNLQIQPRDTPPSLLRPN